MNKLLFLSKLNKFFKTFFAIYFVIISFASLALAQESIWDSEIFGSGDFYDNEKFAKVLKDNYLDFFEDEFGIIEEEVRRELPNESEEVILKVTKEIIDEINRHFNERYKSFYENPVEAVRKRVIAKNPNATEQDIIKEIKKAEILTRLHLEINEFKSSFLGKAGIATKEVKNPYIRIMPKIQKELTKAFGLEERESNRAKLYPDNDSENEYKSFFDGMGLGDFFAYNPLENSQKGRGFGEWLDTGFAKIRLLSAKTAFESGNPFLIGLQIVINDDDAIMPWRYSPDLGKPFKLDFGTSENIASWEIKWPAPKRFNYNGRQLFGYQKMVIIPILITPDNQSKDIKLTPKIDLEICQNECKNFNGEFPQITITSGFEAPSTSKTAIERFIKGVSGAKNKFLSIKDVYFDKASSSLIVKAYSNRNKKNTDIFIESEKAIKFLKPTTMVKGNNIFFRVKVDETSIPKTGIMGEKIIITVTNNVFWLEEEVIIEKIFKDQVFYPHFTNGMLIVALFIGILLNLYPPLIVLNIENLEIAKSFGALNNFELKKRIMARALGVSLFFVILGLLGGVLIKQGYPMVYSIWFKTPQVFWAVTVITFLWLLQLTGRLQMFNDNVYFDVVKGFLISLLSISFLAYFIENQMNFAFFYADFQQLMLIFISIALGVMLPHIFFVAILWDSPQFGFIKISFVKLKNFSFAVVFGLLVWFLIVSGFSSVSSFKIKKGWQKYHSDEVQAAIDEDKIVFLEISSNTCMTCRMIDFIVIGSGAVKQVFADNKVVKMRADLSNDTEDAITILKKFGENKDPVYAFFNKDYPDGFVIQERMGVDVLRKMVDDFAKNNFSQDF